MHTTTYNNSFNGQLLGHSAKLNMNSLHMSKSLKPI